MLIHSTVRNSDWVEKNRNLLVAMFPVDWTPVIHLDYVSLKCGLRSFGVEFESDREFAYCLEQLEKHGILQRDGQTLRQGFMKGNKRI